MANRGLAPPIHLILKCDWTIQTTPAIWRARENESGNTAVLSQVASSGGALSLVSLSPARPRAHPSAEMMAAAHRVPFGDVSNKENSIPIGEVAVRKQPPTPLPTAEQPLEGDLQRVSAFNTADPVPICYLPVYRCTTRVVCIPQQPFPLFFIIRSWISRGRRRRRRYAEFRNLTERSRCCRRIRAASSCFPSGTTTYGTSTRKPRVSWSK